MTPPDLTLPQPELDPTRHWLVYAAAERNPDRFRPIPLDEAAERLGPAAAGGEADTRARSDRRFVVISRERATAIANLLDELALRLAPGTEVRTIQSDGSISRLAKELADDMLRRSA
ncbi:hypothetical protein GCM10010168_69910 [Actinoplanes ianthinogenes]|uniref:Uncharacterized protein n=1 Tax=Actinoplanes ianthinogenes TaxID=122358 RepID=A0ABM7M0R2_9ACTN|nr:hypothetical protein [Actinoplanes ianthinogenes]BCJ45190.1 hypothetical protein Aiant_58470 [Actinoplanes ianthinogenes]GGR41174.1 hypothetical protein GCM10010168_69910 [Actinoplanes ianthinogenes]